MKVCLGFTKVIYRMVAEKKIVEAKKNGKNFLLNRIQFRVTKVVQINKGMKAL